MQRGARSVWSVQCVERSMYGVLAQYMERSMYGVLAQYMERSMPAECQCVECSLNIRRARSKNVVLAQKI